MVHTDLSFSFFSFYQPITSNACIGSVCVRACVCVWWNERIHRHKQIYYNNIEKAWTDIKHHYFFFKGFVQNPPVIHACCYGLACEQSGILYFTTVKQQKWERKNKNKFILKNKQTIYIYMAHVSQAHSGWRPFFPLFFSLLLSLLKLIYIYIYLYKKWFWWQQIIGFTSKRLDKSTVS